MLSAAAWLILSGMLQTLRLSGSGGSFPKPLSAQEERHYLELAAQGDRSQLQNTPHIAWREIDSWVFPSKPLLVSRYYTRK